MAYTNPTEMLALVRELTNITNRDTLINRKLEDSAGTSPANVKTYRPYFVSAKLLQQNRNDQAIAKAEGVEFTNLKIMIESLMDEQLRLDQSLELTIPDGFVAVLDLQGGPVMSIMAGP